MRTHSQFRENPRNATDDDDGRRGEMGEERRAGAATVPPPVSVDDLQASSESGRANSSRLMSPASWTPSRN